MRSKAKSSPARKFVAISPAAHRMLKALAREDMRKLGPEVELLIALEDQRRRDQKRSQQPAA